MLFCMGVKLGRPIVQQFYVCTALKLARIVEMCLSEI
jgi:hypothetical protein